VLEIEASPSKTICHHDDFRTWIDEVIVGTEDQIGLLAD